MKAACVWCLAIVKMPDTFDPKDKCKDVVCSKFCAQQEAHFRLYYSDENIGLRNFDDFGINPNHRGGGHATKD